MFKVNCGFTMQYTFNEAEIGPDGEPTEETIQTLGAELEEYLHKNYGVDLVDVEADFLIGVSDDTRRNGDRSLICYKNSSCLRSIYGAWRPLLS